MSIIVGPTIRRNNVVIATCGEIVAGSCMTLTDGTALEFIEVPPHSDLTTGTVVVKVTSSPASAQKPLTIGSRYSLKLLPLELAVEFTPSA